MKYALYIGLFTVVLGVTAPSVAEDKVELSIELPEPYFGGTPLDYFGPNLEEPNYKPRPPFYVPPGVTNVALSKAVSSSADEPEFGEFAFLVDGDKSYKDDSLLSIGKNLQWIQIDLGAPYDLYALTLWHFHQGDRVYFDVVVKVADNTEFQAARRKADGACSWVLRDSGRSSPAKVTRASLSIWKAFVPELYASTAKAARQTTRITTSKQKSSEKPLSSLRASPRILADQHGG